MKWLWLTIQIILGLLLAAGIFVYVANREIYYKTYGKAQDSITEIPADTPPRVAIVFGAGLRNNGEPSAVLLDRVVTAVELYRSKRVGKLLMSGDNRRQDYSEPDAMKKKAVELGVPEADIVLDFAGRRTYDTCYRAREIFAVKRAVVVTQDFHLNRSIYLCESVGIETVGINADRRKYARSRWLAWREIFANAYTWLDVHVFAPKPVLGKKEPIEP